MTAINPRAILEEVLCLGAASALLLQLVGGLILRSSFPAVYQDLASLAMAAFVFVLAALFIIKKKISNEKLVLTGFEIPVGLLLAAACLGSLNSVYFTGSLLAILVLVSNLIYFYILVDVLKVNKSQEIFSLLLAVSTILVAIFAIWEFFLPSSSQLHGTNIALPVTLAYKRVSSLFDTPNMLAAFCMLLLPGFWAIGLLAQKKYVRASAIVLMGLTVVIFLITLSFLCTVNFILVTIILAPWIIKETTGKVIDKKAFLILGISLVVLATGIFTLRHDLSVASRGEYLKTAWQIIKTHPWVGTGLDTFKILSPQYLSTQTYSGYVHNSYLQLWVETGILGFIAGLLLIAFFLHKAWNILKQTQERPQRILLIASIWIVGAFLLDNVTNFTMLSPDFSLFGWAGLATFCALSPISQEKQIAGHGIALAALVVLLTVSIRMFSSLVYEQNALGMIQKKDFISAYQLLEKAKDLNPGNQFFYVGQAQASQETYFLTHNPKLLEQARGKLEEAVKLSPHMYMNYVLLYRIAKLQNNSLLAQKYLAQVAYLCPVKYRQMLKE